MKIEYIIIILSHIFLVGGAFSQDVMRIHTNNGIICDYDIKTIDSITFKEVLYNWTNEDHINLFLKEMYIPNISDYGDGCYISSFQCTEDGFRLFINNKEKKVVLYAKEYSNAFTLDYYKYNSVTPILDYSTCELKGYCIFNFQNNGYANSGMRIWLDYDIVSNIQNTSQLYSLLSKPEQIVLLGDSKYGYYWSNPLPDLLMGLSGKEVFNLGFGGCRMAWRTEDGTDPYDYFSFSSICDAIALNDFALQQSKCPLSSYKYQIANMKSIDWERPTTILVNFGTNDITGGTPIGDVLQNEFDRGTFVGSLAYGISRIKEKYPHIRFVFLSPDFRLIDGVSIEDYINNIGKNVFDYYDAENEACLKYGCQFVDSYYLNFRNIRNITEFTIDGTHFNGNGFCNYARFLYDVLQFGD